MIGASKILTVSYGTFSCTLEGFDDPFNTMKAIAEYFRDLAAGDRYFGAEPPTPDTAMLHRIAEREVQRRVEAKVQDNGVILRAQYDEPPSAVPLAPVVAEAAAVAQPVADVAQSVAEHAAPEVVPEVALPEVAVPEVAVPEVAVPEVAVADPAELTMSDLPMAEMDTAEPEAAYIAEQSADDAAFAAPAVVTPSLSDMPEGVAARLAKIRAAVALTSAAPAAAVASDYAEDQHAETAFAAVEVFEDSVVPSVYDVSFAAAEEPEEIDETEDLAALDGVDLVTATAEAPRLSNDATVGEQIQPAMVSEAMAEDLTLAEDLYLAEDADDVMVEEINLANANSDLDDTAREGLDDDAQEFANLTTGEAALEQPSVFDADAFDDASDDDVLANLSAAFADERPAATNADTIVFNDDDDMVLGALIDAAEDKYDDEIALYAGLAHEEMPAAEVPQADDLKVEAAFGDDADLADDSLFAEVQDENLPAMAPAPEMAVTVSDAAPAEDTVFAEELAPAPPVAAAIEVPAEEPEAPAAASEKLQRARARIIRVRRAPEIAVAAPVTAPVVLSDEAEAELQRELAALEEATAEAEAATAHVAAITDADDDLRRQLGALGLDAAPQAGAAVPAKPLDPSMQDESLRRLMDQTQSEMAEPSNRRRLSSIAHLKAAVAATIAERFGTKPKPVEEVEAVRTEPYRNDLARAVRPVRPASSTNPGQTERPGPLVLVSEQRIDRPAPVAAAATGPVTPVRPRRVSAQAVAVQQAYDDVDFDIEDEDTDNIFGDAKGFAEFADRIGANDLSELLEAAAAYSAAVEGREHFTRPQLLRQISSVTGAEVTREDELRGFGSLLRDGRIVKVRRGQFALTEASSYLTEARKISG